MYGVLPIRYWSRSDDCKDAKADHMDRIDQLWGSREDLVLQTTLYDKDFAIEPNMFPYDTPRGILHYTLWSTVDLSREEIENKVENWLRRNMPHVMRWNYDDNEGERSFQVFHVHVYFEVDPYSYHLPYGVEQTGAR